MSIYKDKKTKTYYVKFRQKNGKSTTKRGFVTKQDALLYEVKLKTDKEDILNNGSRILFYDLLDDYIKYCKDINEYGTVIRKEGFYTNHIKPQFKNKPVCEITKRECLEFWRYLGTLDCASAYKNDILGALKSAIKYGIDYFDLEKDPTVSIHRFKLTAEEKARRKERDKLIWTYEDFSKFLSVVNNQMYRVMFCILFFTGVRQGELYPLKWSDYSDHNLSINKSLSKKTPSPLHYELKGTKNVYSIRDIKLNDSLNDMILEYKKREAALPGFSEDWFMFGRHNPIPERTFWNKRDEWIAKAGVVRITNHQFRHSHASNLIADGMNIVAVSKRLGHSEITTTLERYTHLMDKSADEVVQDLENKGKDILKNK